MLDWVESSRGVGTNTHCQLEIESGFHSESLGILTFVDRNCYLLFF